MHISINYRVCTVLLSYINYRSRILKVIQIISNNVLNLKLWKKHDMMPSRLKRNFFSFFLFNLFGVFKWKLVCLWHQVWAGERGCHNTGKLDHAVQRGTARNFLGLVPERNASSLDLDSGQTGTWSLAFSTIRRNLLEDITTNFIFLLKNI